MKNELSRSCRVNNEWNKVWTWGSLPQPTVGSGLTLRKLLSMPTNMPNMNLFIIYYCLLLGQWRRHCPSLCRFWVIFSSLFFNFLGFVMFVCLIFFSLLSGSKWYMSCPRSKVIRVESFERFFPPVSNQPSAATALLKGGADGNKRNKNKCSPLHVAVNKGHSEVVKTLLCYSCNVNAQVRLVWVCSLMWPGAIFA